MTTLCSLCYVNCTWADWKDATKLNLLVSTNILSLYKVMPLSMCVCFVYLWINIDLLYCHWLLKQDLSILLLKIMKQYHLKMRHAFFNNYRPLGLLVGGISNPVRNWMKKVSDYVECRSWARSKTTYCRVFCSELCSY